MISLVCPTCGSPFEQGDDALRCEQCRLRFPIVDGIPRLSSIDPYRNDHEDARQLADRARTLGWKAAVEERYRASALEERLAVLDWQRASWIPLLDLPQSSVLLDIGSGHGAVTHALATVFEEVHSIEPDTGRVDFASARLQQEGIGNVRLVQGTVLALPYPPGSFDAIIATGVLERIGDWDRDGTPREVQLRFLRRVHSLLKPGGRLLLGADNRLSYGSFFGERDRSGLPFTNLLPRPVASAIVRSWAKRGPGVSGGAYRTLTYSLRGYRELFAEAGLTLEESYWAEPSHRLPYRLTPLETRLVTASLDEALFQAARGKSISVMGQFKRMLARIGLFERVVKDFVLIARNTVQPLVGLHTAPVARLGPDTRYTLTTTRFAMKTVLRVSDGERTRVVLKCSTPARDSAPLVAREYAEMQSIARSLAEIRGPVPFRLPDLLDSYDIGRRLMTAEAYADGTPIYLRFLPLPPEGRVAFLREHGPRLAESASLIATLRRPGREPFPATSWLEHVRPSVDPELADRAGAIGDRYAQYFAHCDFTIDNTLIDATGQKVTVIDWEYARDGVPPLYDLICLFLSVLLAIPVPADVAELVEDPQVAQFYVAFFHRNGWSALFSELVARERKRLAIESMSTWDIFVDTLLFRAGYLIERNSVIVESRLRFLQRIMGWKDRFQL